MARAHLAAATARRSAARPARSPAAAPARSAGTMWSGCGMVSAVAEALQLAGDQQRVRRPASAPRGVSGRTPVRRTRCRRSPPRARAGAALAGGSWRTTSTSSVAICPAARRAMVGRCAAVDVDSRAGGTAGRAPASPPPRARSARATRRARRRAGVVSGANSGASGSCSTG